MNLDNNDNFRGRVKKIQWNNRIYTGLLSLVFLVGIFLFVTMLIGSIFGLVTLVTGEWDIFYPETATDWRRIVRPYIKVSIFVVLGTLYFLNSSIENIAKMFMAVPVNVAHDDLFYRAIENSCISRGVTMPKLFVINDSRALNENMTTGIVARNLKGENILIFNHKTLNMPAHLLDSYAAQVAHRIHSGDTLFLTILCFLGFFPYHLKQEAMPIVKQIISPFLWITDKIIAPFRKIIIDMRFSRLDVGALEISKDKEAMGELLKILASIKDIRKDIHDPYLPLFITNSDDEVRTRILKSA